VHLLSCRQQQASQPLSGKVALITGATTGIGLATADYLAGATLLTQHDSMASYCRCSHCYLVGVFQRKTAAHHWRVYHLHVPAQSGSYLCTHWFGTRAALVGLKFEAGDDCGSSWHSLLGVLSVTWHN
jgi:hypothetical protein